MEADKVYDMVDPSLKLKELYTAVKSVGTPNVKTWCNAKGNTTLK